MSTQELLTRLILIGGALMTSLSTFWKFLHPGGSFRFGGFSSSALSLGFGFCNITPPPDWSDCSTSDASQRLLRGLIGSVQDQLVYVRYSGTTVHQGI